MLDLKYIRENPEAVKQGINNKNEKDRVDEILGLDEKRRELILRGDELKSERNQVSSQIPVLKKQGKDVSELLSSMKVVSDQITEIDTRLREVENDLNEILMFVPNMPHESVPVGKTADDNIEVRQWTA